MEKARGVQLFKVWDELKDASRFKLMVELAKIEGQLTLLKFPASGSLYYRKSMVNEADAAEIPRENDPGSLYCVGLSCDRSWWPAPGRIIGGHQAPCKSCLHLWRCASLHALIVSRVFFRRSGRRNHRAGEPASHRAAECRHRRSLPWHSQGTTCHTQSCWPAYGNPTFIFTTHPVFSTYSVPY